MKVRYRTMKPVKVFIVLVGICLLFSAAVQERAIEPDLSKVKDQKTWGVHNREVTYSDGVVHMDARPGDGVVWLKDVAFKNGRIELDIRGRDEAGRSFVGLAFHGTNENTYDAIYFRPFNFKNPERSNHSVQYVSHPEHTWNKLRESQPDKYESTVSPVPDPSEWFHAVIVIDHPVVKVFVNNDEKPSLTVTQLTTRNAGWIGFWTGNNSAGDFRNLKVTSRN